MGHRGRLDEVEGPGTHSSFCWLRSHVADRKVKAKSDGGGADLRHGTQTPAGEK